ncbi:J domain-containing protein [Acaryochloris sp. IP29b_bin.148]|uniref:J domain-containing protein n=1 Tax=Acaryochloris sp. IP29b_bin.148 TaxID=2969218 RepID=UPI00261A2C45|nr:J domain-containing protein [Acaryochloris sp. IP29b_bin.148]
MHACEAHLQTLSLKSTASFDEIREAYQDLVMVWHPDRFMHNPRLYKKAEEKLKQVNQAYTYLKAQQTELSVAGAHPQEDAGSAKPPSHAPAPSFNRHHHIACPWLSFADAEYILNHYCFHAVATKDAGHQTYHSGPFVLDTCPHPAEVTLSVPCDSVHGFDRILLSIPCKSRGHFRDAEAEQLLQLLRHQSG